VHDNKKQPLEGANVILVGVPLGAITDATGHYTILNVPAGTYTVKVSYIGYAPTTVQNVAVSADKTTPLDVALSESAVQMKEVVVTAKRPVVELGLTSNVATVTRQEIDKLPFRISSRSSTSRPVSCRATSAVGARARCSTRSTASR
jgi:hypothetical protein